MARPTALLSGSDLAARVSAAVPEAVQETAPGWIQVRLERLREVARFLRDDREIDGRYLNSVSGVDCLSHFEVAYHVTSLSRNHQLTLKVRAERSDPVVPSVASVWLGAHLQEREIYDLLGVRFDGHPSLKRLFLWDGFPGYPLRKDFRALPGGFNPGLQRFPKEDPEQWGGEFRVD